MVRAQGVTNIRATRIFKRVLGMHVCYLAVKYVTLKIKIFLKSL